MAESLDKELKIGEAATDARHLKPLGLLLVVALCSLFFFILQASNVHNLLPAV